MIEIRKLSDPLELSQVVEVQLSAWGMDRSQCEAVPLHMLKAMVDNGGLVLGAFDGDRLVGFSLGWFVETPEGPYFYSHMTGVVSERKYSGLGTSLKLAQRREVLAAGVRLIKWTFDPLQSLNAHFNLGKLGAIFTKYKVRYYGYLHDSINAGLETDRAVAEWYLDSKNVINKISSVARTPSLEELVELGAHVAVVPVGPRGSEEPKGPDLSRSPAAVAIGLPYSVSALNSVNRELASRWREVTRQAYLKYLGEGYVASDFTWDKYGHGYVIMVRESLGEVLDGVRPWS
ncbi:hypothetical protein [Acidilobus saccharovorans]|uniref:hypothetical protein n=1 Tax=Acidilobus saccharovorans TaxID=242703 RepID=UPI0011D0A968|nr:hypothetical protein [Acidilobus saccharovorans]